MPRPRRALLALLALAAALRVAWWALYVDILENEGVEYTRIAWNWFHGRGYVSIFGGTHTLFPPLYPLLIGLAAPLAGSEEAAARLVSLVAGLALVGAVVGLARRVFDERVALLAGLLAACHPLLVAVSVAAYSEGLYIGLSTVCALAAVRCIERPSALRAAAVGALAGLAYLTRPEGIALAVALGGLVLLAGWVRRRALAASLREAALVAAVAGLVAAPYVVHLSRIAGAFRWEGKSWMNDAVAARQREGLGRIEAARGLGPDGEPVGPFLFADQHERLAAPSRPGVSLFETLLADPLGRAAELAGMIARERPLGSPVVLALALVGILAASWWRTRLFEGAVLLALPGIALFVLLALEFTWDRYFWPLLPAGLVWAAAGADRIGAFGGGACAPLGLPARLPALARPATSGVLALGVLVLAARSVTDVGDLKQTRNADVRAAGEWIRTDYASTRGNAPASRPKIGGIGLALAYYAGGEIVYLPGRTKPRALRFLARGRRPTTSRCGTRSSTRPPTPAAGSNAASQTPARSPSRSSPPLPLRTSGSGAGAAAVERRPTQARRRRRAAREPRGARQLASRLPSERPHAEPGDADPGARARPREPAVDGEPGAHGARHERSRPPASHRRVGVGTERLRGGAAADAARALAELRERAGQEQAVEEAAGALDREPAAREERAQLGRAVAAVVPELDVVARVERHPGGDAHEDLPAPADRADDVAQEGEVVCDVLDDVEEEHEVEGAGGALAAEVKRGRRARGDAAQVRLGVRGVEAVHLASGGEMCDERASDEAVARPDVEHAKAAAVGPRHEPAEEARPGELPRVPRNASGIG